MDDALRKEQWIRRLEAGVLLAVTASVVLLSSAGIYALMSFTVSQRRREIGIRIALGASRLRIIAAIFSRALIHLSAGAATGAALGIALSGASGGSLTLGDAPPPLKHAIALARMERYGVFMRNRLIFISFVAAFSSDSAMAFQARPAAAPRETRVPVGKVSLYSREIGQGQPIIVLHGGPDFDHEYLLPDLDRLADSFRLIYYDQRGRGKSADQVQPDEVTLTSDVDDLDKLRQHFGLESPALLGHSWGAVLALEYALRHPERVSRMILMNPAPASASDLTVFRKVYVQKMGPDMDRQREILASAAYSMGDPEAVAARYRLHFKPALARAADYEKLMATMKAGFISQGKEGIVKARAVEDRLMRDTWQREGYDLLPRLQTLNIPTLVIYGDHDFIPSEIATHISRAIPNAQMVTVRNCGHFTYLECPDEVRNAFNDFFRRTRVAARPR